MTPGDRSFAQGVSAIDRNYAATRLPAIIYGSVMVLLKFLKLDPAKKMLPHPSGRLSTIIAASCIVAANDHEEVKMMVTSEEKQIIVFACNSESS